MRFIPIVCIICFSLNAMDRRERTREAIQELREHLQELRESQQKKSELQEFYDYLYQADLKRILARRRSKSFNDKPEVENSLDTLYHQESLK